MRLRCVNIVAQNLDRTVAFYTLVFDRPCTERAPGRFELAVGDVWLVFTHTCETIVVPTDSCGLEFQVEDVDAAYARLTQAGIQIEAPPVTYPWGWRAFGVKDPDGNNLDFVQFVGDK